LHQQSFHLIKRELNLVVDIGNTLTKLAIFRNSEIIYIDSVELLKPELIGQLYIQFPEITQSFISSVSDIPENIRIALTKKGKKANTLDSKTKLPFSIKYKTPDTLGKDRIAAVAGAYSIYPFKNVLVIDAGTAITYELLNSKAEYLGGNISPGLDMRYRALNHFTAKLPLLTRQQEFSLIGESTSEAIINGVQNGLIFEIEGYIRELKNTYPELITIITGGNSQFFEYKLKKSIRVLPNLTLIGLNAILEYNVRE
jgi:type III pantothenate kinase